MNWFVYTSNNPLRYIDPTGMVYVPSDLENATDEQRQAYAEYHERQALAAPEIRMRHDNYRKWVNEYGELDPKKILSGIAAGLGEASLKDYELILRKICWPYDLYKGKQELDVISKIITSGDLEYQLYKIAVAYTLQWKGEIDLLTFNLKGFMESFSPKDVGELTYRTIQIVGATQFQEILNNVETKINNATKSGGDAAGGATKFNYSYTKTAGKHLTDVIKRGPTAGQLSRPYMKSPLTIKEIMATGKGIPDATAKGALNFKVPGSFRGSQGTWELVINPETNLIYHFNFVK